EAYPELRERASEVRDVIGVEAEQFARTLTQGRRMLDEVIRRAGEAGEGGTVSGEDAFRLHDTYGFPLDLTLDAAEDAGLKVDRVTFDLLMEEQRERSRAGLARGDAGLAERILEVARESDPTEFVG